MTNDLTPLCKLMNSYGSDKAREHRHTYARFYFDKLEHLRSKSLNVFELGLGSNNHWVPSNMGPNGKPGASLRAWRDFFPSASVYGADVDPTILFTEERIKTFYCDQTSPSSVKDLWNHPGLKDSLMDVIVEDGLHEYQAHLNFLIHSINKVSKGGFYIAEDLIPDSCDKFEERLNDLKKEFDLQSIEVIRLSCAGNPYDNNILFIHR